MWGAGGADAPRLTLTIRNFDALDNGSPTRLELDQRGAVIGRSATVDWSLPDPRSYISSRHCEIDYVDGGYRLTDVSTNGTFVNGATERSATSIVLGDGDVITIGLYEVAVSLTGAAGGGAPVAAAPAPAPLQGWGAWDTPAAAPASSATASAGGGWGAAPASAVPPPAIAGGGATSAAWTPPAVATPDASGWGAPPAAEPPAAGWGAPAASDRSAPALAAPAPASGWGAPAASPSPAPASTWGAPAAPPSPSPAVAPAPLDDGWGAAPAAAPAAGWGDAPAPAGGDAGSGWGASPPAPPAAGSGWGAPSAPAPAAGFAAPPAAAEPAPNPSAWDAPAAPPPPASGWSSAVPDRPAAPSADDVWGKIAEGNVVDWARGGFGQAAAAPPPPPRADPLGLDRGAAAAALPAAAPGMAAGSATAPRPAPAPAIAPPPAAAPPAYTPPAPAPIPPRAPAAAPPAAPTSAAGGDGLARFLAEAGLKPGDLKGGEAESLAAAGGLVRRLVAGLVVMLEARARAKAQMGAQSTALEFEGNNPIKFARTPEGALAQLLNPTERGFMPAGRAVEDAFHDLQSHQIATLKAMQGALKATLDRFSPTAIKTRAESRGIMARILPGARDAALWQAYEREFGGVAQGSDEAFMDVFSREFKRAYEEQAARRPKR